MSICLAGAHRTGKSTLARLFAERSGWTYVPSRAGEVFAKFGVDLNKPMPWELRLEIQQAILVEHEQTLSLCAGAPWIADRSALDMAAYTALDLMGRVPADETDQVLAYIERCFQVVNRHCAAVVLVQPGIAYKVEDGKPTANCLYVEAMNTYVWGLMNDRRMKAKPAFMQRGTLDLEERVRCLIGLQGKLRVLGRSLIPEGVYVS